MNNNFIVKFFIDNFIDSVYCVGYRFSNCGFWNENNSKFNVLKPSLRYWYADPIPFRYDNKVYVFMERYDRFKQIGDIVVSLINQKGRLDKPKIIISRTTHLSFPIIMSYKGFYYMLPETSATESIDIFRMKESPYQWELYYSIKIQEEIVDVSYTIDNRGILLVGGIPDSSDPKRVKRQIIRIKDLDNIQKIHYEIGYTDEIASLKVRNAGAFLRKDSHIYRVVQESTDSIYGLALILNKILELSDSNIEEIGIKRKDVKNIQVDLKKCFYKKIGMHTYGFCEGGFEVIDISAAKLSLVPLINKLIPYITLKKYGFR